MWFFVKTNVMRGAFWLKIGEQVCFTISYQICKCVWHFRGFFDKKYEKNMNFSTQTDGKYHDFFNIHTANTHMCVGHLT